MVLKIDVDEDLMDKENMFHETMAFLMCRGSSYLLEEGQVLHVHLKRHDVIVIVPDTNTAVQFILMCMLL